MVQLVLTGWENRRVLPADQHVHTQWSADAPAGSMRDACVRAIELGLPGVTFTDHADLTTLVVSDEAAAYIRAIGGTVTDGIFQPPPLEVAGYLDCVEQCRSEFGRSLRIRTGVELSDPHLHPQAAAELAGCGFELIVVSVHSLRRADGFADAADRYADLPDAEVVREGVIARFCRWWRRLAVARLVVSRASARTVPGSRCGASGGCGGRLGHHPLTWSCVLPWGKTAIVSSAAPRTARMRMEFRPGACGLPHGGPLP